MSESTAHVREEIQQRFSKVALFPEQEEKFPVGPTSAKRLGYVAAEIDALPTQVTESFAGVGNPFSLGNLQPGQTVVDIGSGAGLDSILAARRVGPNGKVIGIDMTPEMLAKASRNAAATGLSNTDFRLGSADALPVPTESVDVVISNGVFNLCVNKPAVVAEIFRVLRPGGRLQMADILLEPHYTQEQLASQGTWSDWVSGAIWERSLREMLTLAGFTDVQFHGWTGYRTSDHTQGAEVSACKPPIASGTSGQSE